MRRVHNDKLDQIEKRGKVLLKILVSSVEALGDKLHGDSNVRKAANDIKINLNRPSEIVASLFSAREAIRSLLQCVLLDEQSTKKVVLEHATLLTHLVPLKSSRDALSIIDRCFSSLLSRSEFSQEKVTEEQHALRKAEESLRAAETRISVELVRDARVLLCTIGSSHKLPIAREDDDDESNLSAAFGRLSLATDRSTIVVFDEAGCIPDYEFLGLSRLGRDIQALVCVGDKHQLPPFSAAASKRTPTPRGGGGGFRRGGGGFRQSSFSEPKVTSLLDVSAVEKVKLTTQYRVPHDIANLLNDRIYRGDYKTAPTCKAPLKGFKFIDVPEVANRAGGKQYVNDREIEECIRILTELRRNGSTSIMVLTPVSTTGLPDTALVVEASVRSIRVHFTHLAGRSLFFSTRNSNGKCSTNLNRVDTRKFQY